MYWVEHFIAENESASGVVRSVFCYTCKHTQQWCHSLLECTCTSLWQGDKFNQQRSPKTRVLGRKVTFSNPLPLFIGQIWCHTYPSLGTSYLFTRSWIWLAWNHMTTYQTFIYTFMMTFLLIVLFLFRSIVPYRVCNHQLTTRRRQLSSGLRQYDEKPVQIFCRYRSHSVRCTTVPAHVASTLWRFLLTIS